jgi:hypothetical protein
MFKSRPSIDNLILFISKIDSETVGIVRLRRSGSRGDFILAIFTDKIVKKHADDGQYDNQ